MGEHKVNKGVYNEHIRWLWIYIRCVRGVYNVYMSVYKVYMSVYKVDISCIWVYSRCILVYIRCLYGVYKWI